MQRDNAAEWKTEIHIQWSKCLTFESVDCLPNGHLPTGYEVLRYLLCVKVSNSGRKINNEIIKVELVLHWIYCNVYSEQSRQVTKDIGKYLRATILWKEM